MREPAVSIRTDAEVAIAGGGPAGSAAALHLARRGMRVIVLEKERLPRYKTCGGGVVRRACAMLPADVRHVVERECRCAELTLAGARLRFRVERSEPIITMIMRDAFDKLLLDCARAAGAIVRTECEVLDLELCDGCVRLSTSDGPIVARYLLAADGATGRIARKAGWRETRQIVPALEYEVRIADARMSGFQDSARFDFDLVPYGYAWAFPKRDHLSVGVLSYRRLNGTLHQAATDYLGMLGFDDAVPVERHGYVLPVSPRTDGFMKHRVLLLGDAAGFADPITGEGITGAIQSGQLAAEAIVRGNLHEADVHRWYHDLLGESLLPELRAGRLLAGILYRNRHIRTWVLRRFGRKLSEAVTDVLTGVRTYRTLLSDPANYLKLALAGFSGRQPHEVH